MYLELINDLFMSSSIFYIYFGMLIVTIGISQLYTLNIWKTEAHIYVRNEPTVEAREMLLDHSLIENEPFIIWFVKSFKRIDKLDDDKEDNLTSYFTKCFKIRGGQLWRKTAYSQPYGNIGLS